MIKNEVYQLWYDMIENPSFSPVWIAVSDIGLVSIEIGGSKHDFIDALESRYGASIEIDKPRTNEIAQQIREYLQGERTTFNFPIEWSQLTSFQEVVLKAVYQIPYGETRTYGQIAAQVDRPRASRAVGRANATNPIPLVVPCHRVIGADGSLTGYGTGEGIKTKQWLLEMENKGSKFIQG